MLELFSSGLLSIWLERSGIPNPSWDVLSLVAGPGIPGFVIASDPEPTTTAIVQQYLKQLATKGISPTSQGIWIQSGPHVLASSQGTQPLSAASLTKVATSLAALEQWGPDHQFETLFKITGPIQDGVVQGDLVIAEGRDPFFIWEEAMIVGQALNKIGIKKIAGNLIISDQFVMNFESDPLKSGEQFKEALDSKSWLEEAQFVYSTLPSGTPKPHVEIAGSVKIGKSQGKPLMRHLSLPLVEIIRQMNIYSNNEIAQILADSVGGATVVRQQAAKAAGVPVSEIELINGSGLGQENRISPRAVGAMFLAIQRYLYPHRLSIADLFPVSGRDGGTLDYRQVPKGSVIKTGTLWDVSALAGVLPTRDQGLVWFVIINRGEDIDMLRQQQDKLLQALQKQWGSPSTPLAGLTPKNPDNLDFTSLGTTNRNEILIGG
jgi:D-alanyl-D-alanine carboxypeptidase/D-alanyl-D-alanine-endopeptidase (penicillin-binding protein 4)